MNTNHWTGGRSTVGARPYWGFILVVPPALFDRREVVRQALREYPGVTVIKSQMLPVDRWKNTGRYRKD